MRNGAEEIRNGAEEILDFVLSFSSWNNMSNTSPELYEFKPVSVQLSIAPPYNTLPVRSAELSLKTNSTSIPLERLWNLKEALIFFRFNLMTVNEGVSIVNVDGFSKSA